jgi:predicted nucleic acid-binding protein
VSVPAERCVVDASVAVKWLIREAQTDEARRLVIGGYTLVVPDLLFAEVGNALWKRVRAGDITAAAASRAFASLAQFNLTVRPIRPLAPFALVIAARTQRTVYDSLYVALAVSEQCPLVTADLRLYNALTGTPFQQHVAWIADLA